MKFDAVGTTLIVSLLTAGVAHCEERRLDTPQDVFQAQRDAVNARDWKRFFSLQTTGSRLASAEGCLAAVCSKAFVRPGDPLAQKLLRKYGIEFAQARSLATVLTIVGEDEAADSRNVANSVAPMIKQVEGNLLEWLSDSFSYALAQSADRSYIAVLERAEMTALVIQNDRAKALLVPDKYRDPAGPIYFIRIDGQWFITTRDHEKLEEKQP